jgi:hypothetical protein
MGIKAENDRRARQEGPARTLGKEHNIELIDGVELVQHIKR